MNRLRALFFSPLLLLLACGPKFQNSPPGQTPASADSSSVRTIPARTLPTPSTVSPGMQKLVAAPWQASTAPLPKTTEQWKAMIKSSNEGAEKSVAPLKQQFHVSVEEKTIAGVHVFSVKPETIPPANRNRLLVHVHGGAYIVFAGQAGLPEAILMAHYAQTEVLSIDYRMPPDFPFPAAVDDTVAVWKELLKSHSPKNMALFGTSAGGGLTLAAILKMKELHLPLPGALMAGTP